MKSDLPKVLHRVAGKPMILHVVACAGQVVPVHHIHVVVGYQADKVRQAVSAAGYPVNFCLQKRLMGTGDAVKCALPALSSDARDVVVLYGDVPLIQQKTVKDLVSVHRQTRAKVTILAADLDQPGGYGRVLQDRSQRVVAIREDADATEEERKIKRVNTGLYCFDRMFLSQALNSLVPANQQAEYYLTDVVEIACQSNEKVAVKLLKEPSQALGINTRVELEKTRDLAGFMPNELP